MPQGKPAHASLFRSPPTPQAVARVRELIKSGQQERAVETAKDLHRQQPTPDSELLLAEAYAARILSFDPQLVLEADALYRLALERCPVARESLEALRPRLDVRFLPRRWRRSPAPRRRLRQELPPRMRSGAS